MTEPDENVH